MHSFEIEVCPKAQSRDVEFVTGSLWDGEAAGTSPSQRWGLLRRFHSDSAATDRAREVRQQFENDLAEARLEDTHDLEMLDFVRLGSCDREGRETLLFIAKHVPNDVIRLERTQRFIMQKLESVGQKSYSILYIHTGSNLWNSQLGLRITWNLFRRVPREYRDRLDKIYVVHPDMYLQVAMGLFVRWFMHSLWEKVQYFSRLENLQSHFPTVIPHLPPFVKEHDIELEAHPLMDYGFCTLSEVDTPDSYSGPAFYT